MLRKRGFKMPENVTSPRLDKKDKKTKNNKMFQTPTVFDYVNI